MQLTDELGNRLTIDRNTLTVESGNGSIQSSNVNWIEVTSFMRRIKKEITKL